MYVREIQSHQHSATVTTDALRVQVRGFRDSEGQEFEEVVVSALGQHEIQDAVYQGRQVRVIRIPMPAIEGEAR